MFAFVAAATVGYCTAAVGHLAAGCAFGGLPWLWRRWGAERQQHWNSPRGSRNFVRVSATAPSQAVDAELLFRSPATDDGSWPAPTDAELAQLNVANVFGVRTLDARTQPELLFESLDEQGRAELLANRGGPVLLRGLTDGWRIRRWTQADWTERVGDQALRLRPCATVHEYGFPGPSDRTVSLREYFAGDASCGSGIVFENDFQDVHAFIRGDYEIPALLADIHNTPVFSGGMKHTGIGFHRHNEAWFAQMHGRKAWFLLPPASSRPPALPPWWYLHERPPDLQMVVQEPGEVLYVPENWWHATWNLDAFTVGLGWEGGPSRKFDAQMHAIADGDVSRLDAAEVPSPQMTIFAARTGHADVMRWLIEEDADISLRANAAPAVVAAARGGHVAMLELLGGYRTALQADSKGRTGLHAAAQYGHPSAARWLLEKRADVNARDEGGSEPLQLAASHGHPALVDLLLDAGANVDAVDAQGSAALPRAAFNGHRSVVKQLVNARANVKAADALQMTPLHLAAIRGYAPVAHVLIAAGADVNAGDRIGRTPLHLAAHGYEDFDDPKNGFRTAVDANMAVASTLLLYGAGPSLKDQRGQTALQYATARGHFGVAQLLQAQEPEGKEPPTQKQGA